MVDRESFMRKAFITGICFGCSVFGQTSTAVLPADKVPLKAAVPDLLKQYDYGAQIGALNDLSSLDPSSKHEVVTPQFATSNKNAPRTESASRPAQDISLSPTALAAVRVSEKWSGGTNEPAAGADGRVLYSFGAGSDATSVIALKPMVAGLDTNLLIATDRRAYYLRLISKPEEYVARVAFQYPEDDNAHKWQQQIADQRTAARQNKRDAEASPAMMLSENLNFGYRISGKSEHVRPIRVYDDGAKTYIQMPPEMQHREVPVLLVLGADGKGEMTNYRVRQQTYIVDRLFDRAQLVLGTGKKSQKVEISREPKG